MTRDELATRLQKKGPAALAAFLVQLADDDDALRERVEALALRGDPSGSAAALERRLRRFRDGRSFIRYRESGGFARELYDWLDDAEATLLDADPQAAWRLFDRFLRTDERILSRADDSNGSIGDAYRRACGLWHRAAAGLPAGPERVARVYELHAGNDYGTRDAILDEAATSLSELELRRLARRYEQEAEDTTGEEDDQRSFSASVAMGQVACALQDASLYERSVRIRSPRPNSLQAANIAEQYLRFGPAEKAVEWLTRSGSDSTADVERPDLLERAYEALGGHPKPAIDGRLKTGHRRRGPGR